MGCLQCMASPRCSSSRLQARFWQDKVYTVTVFRSSLRPVTLKLGASYSAVGNAKDKVVLKETEVRLRHVAPEAGVEAGQHDSEALQYAFPQGFRKTEYGYSGVAKVPDEIIIAFDANDTGLESKVRHCMQGDGKRVDCSDCADGAAPCVSIAAAPKKLARDDMINTGVVPSHIHWPLRLTVTEVVGAGFDPEKICSPANAEPEATNNTSNRTAPAWTSQDIFFTLSDLDLDTAKAKPGAGNPALYIIGQLSLLCCCCICVSALGYLLKLAYGYYAKATQGLRYERVSDPEGD